MPDDFAIGTAFVTDVTVNHVDTLYSGGTPTLAALAELLELCQAAILHDHLAVSPLARSHSSFLGELDCVYARELTVEPAAGPDEQDALHAAGVEAPRSADDERVDGMKPAGLPLDVVA